MHSPPGPARLPPLRKGISFTFSDYDPEGKPQWVIHDAGVNRFYLIGWLEYEILSRWDVGDPNAILASIEKETTLHADMQDLEHFYQFLSSHFLIQQSGYAIHESAKKQNLFKNENPFQWLVEHYLFFRIPLCHPDRFLIRTRQIGEWLFHRYTAMLMSVLALTALYQLSLRWETFTHTFSTIFTLKGMLLYMVAFSVCKLFHELGHAWRCRHYGIPVPTLGIAFLVFWPVLYTDTTLSWSLPGKKRMQIALAGIWAETYVTIIAALIWCNTTSVTLLSITYLVISVNWIASLLINVSPFMRFDGYYILADFLRMPNLQPRAFALTRWQIRRWLFDWPDPPPETFGPKLHFFLVTYSILTWLYRLVLYLGIAVLVYHFVIKIVGILLFVIEIYYFIVKPVWQEGLFWFSMREKFRLNLRTNITVISVLILAVFFLLPISQTLSIPATLEYAHQMLYTPEAGILQGPLPPAGTPVKKNQIIATLYSPWIEEALRETWLEYEKTLNELRRAEINHSFSGQKNILLSSIDKLRSQYDRLQQRKKKLVLRAPFDGQMGESPSDLSPGITLKKDEWLGNVIDTTHFQIEGFVSEKDTRRVWPGQTGYFYSSDTAGQRIPATVRTIEILNARELNCHFSSDPKSQQTRDILVETPCYHISEFGGDIPAFQTPEGSYVPVNSVYLVMLDTSQKEVLPFVRKGTVTLHAPAISLASRVFYQIKKIWVEESGI